ncbi:hypothetical protein [Pararhodospirillum photometricum]|nr:hypothetical protein [Pararhodospirillum photometricum]
MSRSRFRALQPLPGVALAGLAAVLATRLRYDFIEPERLGAACEKAGPWWCGLRRSLIMTTEWKGIGAAALLLAVLAAWGFLRHRRDPVVQAIAALIVGGFGIVLYNATFSALAIVIAALVLAQHRAQTT